MEKVTIESILSWFSDCVASKHAPSPVTWVEGAMKINALMHEFNTDLVQKEMAYRRLRADLIVAGDSSSSAEAKAKASPEYMDYLTKKLEADRIQEFIMLAKKRSSLQDI